MDATGPPPDDDAGWAAEASADYERREWISDDPRYGSATAPSITDEELLHLALAYVKRVHGQDPDLPARVAFLLEALRERRGSWERGEQARSGRGREPFDAGV